MLYKEVRGSGDPKLGEVRGLRTVLYFLESPKIRNGKLHGDKYFLRWQG